ncbi:hypothetical protein EXIGLDRAFT_833356, partial [Exidia glandulosa HHB12029]
RGGLVISLACGTHQVRLFARAQSARARPYHTAEDHTSLNTCIRAYGSFEVTELGPALEGVVDRLGHRARFRRDRLCFAASGHDSRDASRVRRLRARSGTPAVATRRAHGRQGQVQPADGVRRKARSRRRTARIGLGACVRESRPTLSPRQRATEACEGCPF